MRSSLFAVLGFLCVVPGIGCVTAVAAISQPTDVGWPVLELTTTTADGNTNTRVLAHVIDDGVLYVGANHWWRPWYHEAIANPSVSVTIDGVTRRYRAIEVVGDEHEHRMREAELPLVARILTGFPPRRFLRLEPEEAD